MYQKDRDEYLYLGTGPGSGYGYGYGRPWIVDDEPERVDYVT